jgi:prefoldin subunit 5
MAVLVPVGMTVFVAATVPVLEGAVVAVSLGTSVTVEVLVVVAVAPSGSIS